ncbi:putative meiosis recombination protein SPO11 [Trypanosoma cruzi]|uniref:Putative meiosis recombination protein SPO11 n=1 Tax=Trypanosoma cruzi TaxID=5693 RepID=A0A2V2WF04_TRYCR|nr:putative meiosis recombination protein SPO11 [Trypanosoma cruzi]
MTLGNVSQTQFCFEKTSNYLTGTVEMNGMRHSSGILVNMAVGMRGCHFRGAEGVGSLPSAVILVEKESTLRTLVVAEGVLGLGAPLNRCSFLCSKGYPCRASRTLLHKLHCELPQLPILVLVDGDPHGMRIALTFLGLFGGVASTRRRKQKKKAVCLGGIYFYSSSRSLDWRASLGAPPPGYREGATDTLGSTGAFANDGAGRGGPFSA